MSFQSLSSEYIEKVDIASFGKGAKVVGVSAPSEGEGASTLCGLLSKRSQEMGKKTCLVVFKHEFWNVENPVWRLGEPLKQGFYQHEEGYFVLNIINDLQDTLLWSDPENITKFISALKNNFERIIIDLPPVIERNRKDVSPVPIAAVCDCLVLIALVGQLTSISVKELVYTLEQAGVKIAGIILNDRDYPTVGMELARQAEKLKFLMPKIAQNFAQKARDSEFLNLHI